MLTFLLVTVGGAMAMTVLEEVLKIDWDQYPTWKACVAKGARMLWGSVIYAAVQASRQ